MQLIVTTLRGLRRSPRFALAVVLTLGIGVGAGASVFALVEQLLLRPPSQVKDAGRVRRMTLLERPNPTRRFTSTSLAWVDYVALSRSTRTLDGVAAYRPSNASLGRGPDARRIATANVTASFFTVLGIRPALGRFFVSAEDEERGSESACIASHAFWRGELGGNVTALGRRLLVGNVMCTVIGVAPRGFNGVDLGAVDIWLPMRAGSDGLFGPDPELWTTDRSHWVRIIARLGDDVDDLAADQDATQAYRTFAPRIRDPDLTGMVRWEPVVAGRFLLGSRVSISALLFAGSMVLLLLIAANLINLYLVREMGRAQETAIRLALGGSRWSLFAQRVTESALLALLAGALGLTLATWLAPAVRTMLLGRVTFASSSVNLRVASVTVGMALVTGVVIAAVSTLRLRASDPAHLLRTAGSARSGSGATARTARLGLVGLQAALSAALMIASIGFVRSFRQASNVDLGFDRHGVVVAQLLLDEGDDLPVTERELYGQARERAAALPGVTSASLGYMTPWWNNRTEIVSIPDRDTLPPAPVMGLPLFDAVTPDYLVTMAMRMRAGRWISERDVRGGAPVIVINEALAELYWPGEQPIGRCLRVGERSMPCREVIGVVANHRFTGSLEAEPVAAYFLPLAQSGAYAFTPRLFVRTSGNPEALIPTLRRMLQGLAPNLPAANLIPLDRRFDPLVAPWRLGSWAFTALGALATVVGTFGLFSILSYVVAERRREFAIRSAVGASARQIALPVVRQGVFTVFAGVASGVLVAVAAARWLQPLLFNTSLTDPLVVSAVMLVSLAIGVAASLAPARVAGMQNPMDVLRAE